MSTAVATRQEQAHATPPSTINAVRQMEKQFALALPEHVSAERFVRIVVTAIQSNPDLQSADRDSVLGAALKCAQDGLIPDGREAALVVYNTKVKYKDENGRDREAWVKKAQYMPMIAGILTKVRRSGELHSLSANVVYEKDAFEYELGDEERLIHRPYMSGPRGKAIAAYAIAKTKDGGIYREVMSVEQIEKVRGVSRAKNNGPWVDWWDEMARKSVMRRLSKRLPMSTDLTQIFARDDDHYDLSATADSQAKLRRLHADFDDAPAVAPSAQAPAIADQSATDATFEDAPAEDEPEVETADADDSFPGDLPLGLKRGSDLLKNDPREE